MGHGGDLKEDPGRAGGGDWSAQALRLRVAAGRAAGGGPAARSRGAPGSVRGKGWEEHEGLVELERILWKCEEL